MKKRSMLVLCIGVAIIGIMLAISGGIGGREVTTPKAILGIIIAACGLGGAMGTSVVATGVCLVSAVVVLVLAGISAGSVLLCCIPAMMLALHLTKVTGNC